MEPSGALSPGGGLHVCKLCCAFAVHEFTFVLSHAKTTVPTMQEPDI